MKKLMGFALVAALSAFSLGCAEPAPPPAKPANMPPAPTPMNTPTPMSPSTPGGATTPAESTDTPAEPTDEKPAETPEENK